MEKFGLKGREVFWVYMFRLCTRILVLSLGDGSRAAVLE